MEARTVEVIVRGMVQGVGFRYATWRRAYALQLSGWVRNRPDGTVEVVCSGPRDAVEQMISWLGHGPSAARVRGVDVSEIQTGQLSDEFEIRV